VPCVTKPRDPDPNPPCKVMCEDRSGWEWACMQRDSERAREREGRGGRGLRCLDVQPCTVNTLTGKKRFFLSSRHLHETTCRHAQYLSAAVECNDIAGEPLPDGDVNGRG
jgi:hypothetical protein